MCVVSRAGIDRGDTGDMRSGQRHGYGLLELIEGGRYTGMLAFDLPHGCVSRVHMNVCMYMCIFARSDAPISWQQGQRKWQNTPSSRGVWRGLLARADCVWRGLLVRADSLVCL
jgi:hypothetical protein